MSGNRIDEAVELLGLTEEDKQKLVSSLEKDADELTPEEGGLIIRMAGALRRKDEKENYKKRPTKKREADHKRVWTIIGAYTAFIAAACLAAVGANRGSSYDAWAVSLWAISLPYLCGAMLLDYRVRVVQRRQNSKVFGLLIGVGGASSYLGTTAMVASFSWLGALIFLLSPLLVALYLHEVSALGGEGPFEEL